MGWPIAGIIEGFYGRPWTWDERSHLMRFCRERGMTHWVYAPKNDPLHRKHWREPYNSEALDGFARLAGEQTLQLGFGISPGLTMSYASGEDRAALAAKVDQVVGVGVGLVCLALDDIPFAGDPQGKAHAELTTWLREHLADRADLVLVPTEYVGTAGSAYLDALAAGVPTDVPIGWTGELVVNDAITVAQATARAEALGGRAPLIWDNYPVNDGLMTDRLHLGPLWGREPGLVDVCSGYLANPMVQPNATALPLASTAAWLQGDDPLEAWAADADASGTRVFAEACDGAVPQSLVQSVIEWLDDARWTDPAAPLQGWLTSAAECEAPGLEDEVGPWLAQVHAEARLGLDALRLVALVQRGEIGMSAIELAFAIGMTWQVVRRSDKTVMGPRCSMQPALGQRPDGTWSFRAESLLENGNAIDALVRAALSLLASRSGL